MADDTLELQLRFDLRVPPMAKTDHATQYRACLEMVEWGERMGFSDLTLSEHHNDEAGYLAAPMTLAAAVLARTSRIKVSISAALVPLHDPLRVAEQLAVLDLIGPGRISAIFGAGYRKVEFESAGVDRKLRGKLVEECVEACKAAWTGEPFEFRGRTVMVRPTPATPGGPHIAVGGKTELAARRAARLRCHFSPANNDPALTNAYREECARLGYEGKVEGLGDKPMRAGFVMVSEDPESTWAEIAPLALYDAESYASWQDDPVRSYWVVPNLENADDLRTSGRYLVLTPEEAVEQISKDRGLTLHPLMGGIHPDLAWESLRLLEHEVLPKVR